MHALLAALLLPTVAKADTYTLSAEVHRAHEAIGAGLTGETCVPTLEGYYRDLEHLNFAEVDLGDVSANGGATIRELFDARLALHEQERSLAAAGALNDDCLRSIRRADLAGRYLSDYLYEALPTELRPDLWLANTAFAFHGALEDFQSGDVLVTRAARVSSAGIAHIGRIDSQFSHNALVYVDPKTNERFVVEAYLEMGAETQPLADFLEDGLGRVVVMRHRDADRASRAAAAAYDRVRHGKAIAYDADFNYEDHSELFCSEIARWAYGDLIGEAEDIPSTLSVFDHQKNPHMFDAMGIPATLTSAPSDMLFDTGFDIVGEWRDPAVLTQMRYHDAIVESVFTWMEERGYDLDPTHGERFLVGFGLTVRRIPVLGLALKRSIHPKGDKSFLVASLALQDAGLGLEGAFMDAVGTSDHPLMYTELRAILEQLRLEDLDAWRADPKTARFHRTLHPAE